MYTGYLDKAFKDKNLSKLDVEIYWRLRNCSLGYAKDQKTLCNWTGKAKGSVCKSIKRLLENGYISRHGNKIICLKFDFEEEQKEHDISSSEQDVSLSESKVSLSESDTIYIKHKENIINNNTQKKETISKKKSTKDDYDKYMDLEEYPNIRITKRDRDLILKKYNNSKTLVEYGLEWFNNYLDNHPERLHGKKAYKCHRAVINTWVIKNAIEAMELDNRMARDKIIKEGKGYLLQPLSEGDLRQIEEERKMLGMENEQ